MPAFAAAGVTFAIVACSGVAAFGDVVVAVVVAFAAAVAFVASAYAVAAAVVDSDAFAYFLHRESFLEKKMRQNQRLKFRSSRLCD